MHEHTLDNLRLAWSVERRNAALVERIRHTRRIQAAMPDRTLDSPEAIFTATRALKDRKELPA